MIGRILSRGMATVYLWACQIMHWCHLHSRTITGIHEVVDESGFSMNSELDNAPASDKMAAPARFSYFTLVNEKTMYL